jgi:DNA-binding response OmpR family regulator
VYRILVVDDALIVQELVRAALEPLEEEEGTELLFCEDGYRALEMIEEQSPDLVILDITLVGPSGFEVCRRVKRELGRDLTVLILSARGLPEDRRRAERAGAEAWVTKPFEPRDLLALVRSLLRRRRGGGALEE